MGGLSCAFELLKNGIKVFVIEKGNEVGGLMKSEKFKFFSDDFGLKNLDNGIPEVYRFWKRLLKEDYSPIELRTGIFYNINVLELEKTHEGLRCGMPLRLLIEAHLDMVYS